MSDFPVTWLVAIAACYVAVRSLIALANRRREDLQGLLSAHVKRARVESLKKRRIRELREKIRAKKAMEKEAETRKAA
jgi:hypothetical protein